MASTIHLDSHPCATAAIRLTDCQTRIYHRAADGAIHETYRQSGTGTPSHDRIVVPARNVRLNTPIAATTWGANFHEIRLYFIDRDDFIHELGFIPGQQPPTDSVVGPFDDKKYKSASGSTLLYAISTDNNPRVGFQSASAPTSITEAAYTSLGGWKTRHNKR